MVDSARRSDDFVAMLSLSREASLAAHLDTDPRRATDALVAFADDDPLATLLVAEALAAVPHEAAGHALAGWLEHEHALVQRHASWRLAEQQPIVQAYPMLVARLGLGGIDTMHAHRTLRRWALSDPIGVLQAAAQALAVASSSDERARLVDLVGAVPTDDAMTLTARVAASEDEPTIVRIAAAGALGARQSKPSPLLGRLAAREDELGAHALLVVRDLEGPGETGTRTSAGLRVAQLSLATGIDDELRRGGRGDTGGVANLLVSLGAALGRTDAIGHVLTISRGTAIEALEARDVDPRRSYATLPLDVGGRPLASDDLWGHLPAVERSIRRTLRRNGGCDLIHLRMADVGTLAGSEVATSLGITRCFSVAPDPHNVMHSLRQGGELDDRSFLALDADSHLWFRARLVEHLAAGAERLAMFPRDASQPSLADFGIPTSRPRGHARVVAEGIDLRLIEDARSRAAATAPDPLRSDRRVSEALGSDVLQEIADLVPPDRRGLPLLVSVGRLHPVKGMDRVARAWSGHPALRSLCNLLIVGGDLRTPTATERMVLDDLDVVAAGTAGLMMLGGRPRADIARILVAIATGHGDAWAAGGVYVDGALKEEFGLAVLEALAAGLVVVAPSTGGPATYVEPGETGVLAAPTDDLGHCIIEACSLVDRAGRVERARMRIERDYSIDTMASDLAELYTP